MAIDRIQEFIISITDLNDESTIQNLSLRELDYLRSELALTSVRRSATRYRNAIKLLSKDHPALKYFKLTQDEQSIVKQANKTQVYFDHTNLRPIDPDSLILKGTELLESSSYLNVALGLMILTGRRSTEVLKTAEMFFIDQDTVIFAGQLKTKGSSNAQTEPYEIPVLTESQIVIGGLIKLRQLRDFSALSNDQVHSKTNKSLNEAVKRQFKGLIRNVMPKDLRSAYATIAHYFNCPDHISQVAYFAQVLGHSKEDLTTAQSYQDFYIAE